MLEKLPDTFEALCRRYIEAHKEWERLDRIVSAYRVPVLVENATVAEYNAFIDVYNDAEEKNGTKLEELGRAEQRRDNMALEIARLLTYHRSVRVDGWSFRKPQFDKLVAGPIEVTE